MPAPAAPPEPAAPSRPWHRVAVVLATLLVAAAAFDGITLPWSLDPERGLGTTAYVVPWIANNLAHGLGVTLGAPVVYVGEGATPTILVNWHHPAFYPLWLSGFAAVLGDAPWVLRLAHLLLFLPSVPALYLLVRRHVGATAGAAAALLYATCPYATYYGLMVMQDGLTMAFAVIACWLFQRHLDAPARHRLAAAAFVFFLCGVNDIPGYFTGFSLFTLALLHPAKVRALCAVAVMFSVSLAAFALTAWHYGLFLGGPTGWVHAMLHVADFEAGNTETLHQDLYLRQARHVLLHNGALPLVLLAAIGPVVGAICRVPGTGRLLAIGLVAGLPGIVNYLAFPSHAPMHMYWPLPAIAGVAVAAAAAVHVAATLLGSGGRRFALGLGLLLAALGAAGYGTVRSHTLIGGMYGAIASDHEFVEQNLGPLRGCKFLLTTVQTGFGQFFGQEYVAGGIDTPELLDALIERARGGGMQDEVGFVLPIDRADTPLRRRLQQLAEPMPGQGALLFRFRVPR